MLRRILISVCYFFIITFLTLGIFTQASAVTCSPPFNGNRTVEADCTYPTGGIKVYGDINVGTRTITVPTGGVLGINLTSNKVTFTTGKILFQGTGKMDNSVSNRTYISISYSAGGTVTACPSGYAILNAAGTAFQGGTETTVAGSGTIRCGKL